MFAYPWYVMSDLGVNPWFLLPGTSEPPAHHPLDVESKVFVRSAHQGAPRITLEYNNDIIV